MVPSEPRTSLNSGYECWKSVVSIETSVRPLLLMSLYHAHSDEWRPSTENKLDTAQQQQHCTVWKSNQIKKGCRQQHVIYNPMNFSALECKTLVWIWARNMSHTQWWQQVCVMFLYSLVESVTPVLSGRMGRCLTSCYFFNLFSTHHISYFCPTTTTHTQTCTHSDTYFKVPCDKFVIYNTGRNEYWYIVETWFFLFPGLENNY